MLKITSFLSALCALAFTTGSAEAQTSVGSWQRQPEQPPSAAAQYTVMTPPAPAVAAAPRFIVRATTLYANDETGRDWPGSDEIYVVFELRGPDEQNDAPDFFARTSVFEDFDTGETKAFRASQNCLTSAVATANANAAASAWDCHPSGDIGPLRFSVSLYEEDVREDDLIGERTVQWSREELASAMLEVGGGSEESIRIGGYTLTWRVERVS